MSVGIEIIYYGFVESSEIAFDTDLSKIVDVIEKMVENIHDYHYDTQNFDFD